MGDLILKVDDVSKEYRLGAIGGTTLRDDLQRLIAKIRHKEDPTAIIGKERMTKSGKFKALSNISFEARAGEAIGIIGHNGAGKSTLLKLITRVTAPTSGRICLNGRVASMLEVGTGFHPELTGRENIYVNGAILGMNKKEIDSKIDQIIEFSECKQFIDTPVKRYSSGMYVKLAFSVAAHLDSEIMIMDEVLAVGDVAFQNKCIQKMKEIAESGRTILYVSHSMATIKKLCTRCICLSKGEIIYDGTVDEGIDKYLNSSSAVIPNPIELTNSKRHGIPSGKTHYLSADFIGLKNTSLSLSQNYRLKLTWEGKEQIDKLYARLHIKLVDNTCIGVVYADPVSSKVGINEAVYNLDLSSLIPGRYHITLLAYELDDYGSEVRHECVEPAFSIEVTSDELIFNNFNPAWGNIRFNQMTLRGKN